MIYTCYEMIQDCRAGKPAGWSYFDANYTPVVRRLAAHYGAASETERILQSIPQKLFQSLQPVPERHFVAALRQAVLAAIPTNGTEAVDLEVLAQALAPLSVVEKKTVWLETMRYGAEDTSRILRMDPKTVQRVRDKAAELMRAGQDRWSRSFLQDHGLQLGRAAAERKTEQCIPAKSLLDSIDGRSTWLNREQMERHITACLHCVDHFCRLHEVSDLLRARE